MAPLAVNVAVCPVQIVAGLVANVGVAVTATEAVVVFTQPEEDVPVIVYVWFEVGLTVTELPLNPPGLHVYVDAPLAVNPTELPEHNEAFATLTTGTVLTVTAVVCVPLHEPVVPPIV